MFTTESEKRDYAIKPMNCPGHVLIYNKGLRSYRELPLRYGEFGVCTRNEPSGALHGIMRIRAFTQDEDRKSTRLNSSHRCISYAVFCLKKKKKNNRDEDDNQ